MFSWWVGLAEKRTGSICLGLQSARSGRKRWEDEHGEVALVTNAQQGIGKAIALAYGREGASVVVNYLDDQAAVEAIATQIRTCGREAVPVAGDVSRLADVQRMVEAGTALGGIDIVVNNAGIFPRVAFLDMSESLSSTGGPQAACTGKPLRHHFLSSETNLSRPRLAALRLAVSCCGAWPPRMETSTLAANERQLPTEALACPRGVLRGCTPEGPVLKCHLHVLFSHLKAAYGTDTENRQENKRKDQRAGAGKVQSLSSSVRGQGWS